MTLYITDAFEGGARPARITAKLISRLGSLAKRLKERPELRLIFESNVQINFPITILLPNTLILLLTRDPLNLIFFIEFFYRKLCFATI